MNEDISRMHWKEICGKPFLSGDDVPEGKEFTVTITDITKEKVFKPNTKKEEDEFIITFHETELRFIPNVTNCRAIASWHGNKVKGWIGKKITLYRHILPNCFGKKNVPCLRVKYNK